MMDVWKSNARRFCEIYKVKLADNRNIMKEDKSTKLLSRLNYESKTNKKKKRSQYLTKSDLQATLAMMESAASKSMRIGDSCPSAGIAGPVPKPKKYMDPRAQSASIAEMTQQKKAEYKTENEKYDPESETVWVKARQTMVHIVENYCTTKQYAIKLAIMENKTDAVAKNQKSEMQKRYRQNSNQEKLTLNLTKEEPLEESSCNRFIQNEYSNLKEENIDIKNETEKITEEIIEQKSSPYDPWIPIEKIPEKPKSWSSQEFINKLIRDWTTEEQGRGQASELILAPEDLVTFSDKSAMIKRKKIDVDH
uniref:Uncharacterized protein n=1 Tax=Wuchereria bancrofti TaxID=6293 RepID=A0A1I8EKI9_WUCBA